MRIRKTLALLLSFVLAAACIPFGMFASAEDTRLVGNGGLVLDTDAAGGYEGDYVVIYNPATSSSTSYSTGTMTGLIETSVGSKAPAAARSEELAVIDVDGEIAERDREMMGDAYGKINEEGGTRASYQVGSTRSFSILAYSPGGSSITFKVLAVGQHCYIWTPSSNQSNYYTLDSINPDYAQQAADEFDRMYDLMNASFGNHSNGTNGDGKVSLLFYNIDDGFDPETSSGYIAGYFSGSSYSYDGLPIINLDTYPGIYYVTASGVDRTSMDRAYGTACHEYQHCINYSNTSSMSTWLNECFSAAAEEICYPGSSIVSRIQSWEQYFYSENDDWQTPPDEFKYTSALTLHNGFSMYNWNNNLEMDDTLALYAQVSFFAQYLYTQFGNTIYKQISNKYTSNEATALTNATGINCAELVKNFRIAVFANDHQAYDGQYGFIPQTAYDPAEYHDVADPYNLLGPVVFTGSSCSIKGGGAICVKPVNGVYNPPSGANSNLVYIGITRSTNVYEVSAVSNNEAYGTVSVNGTKITCTPADGYYVEGYEVISGTATATVNGNIINVSPTSDCTIRVIFAPKPVYTVSFVASGTNVGSQSAYVYDVINLPTAVSVDPEGWTFSGWVDSQIVETTDKPAFYAPGAEFTVTENTTLYALYTRVEGSSEIVYQLVTEAPADWANNYVITSGTNTSMYVLKGISGNTSYESTSSGGTVTFANSGMTLDGTYLRNVGSAYIFAAASVGTTYSLQNASTSTYLGSYNNYLYSRSSYSSSYCNWSIEYDASNACMKVSNSASSNYPYLVKGSNSYFVVNSTYTTNKTQFWAETNLQTIYYNTDPVAAQPTEYTVTFVDWDGTVLSTQVVEEGGSAVAPETPYRYGYTFIGWDVSYTNVTADITVTALYTPNTYLLTINYCYEDYTEAYETYTAYVEYGASYSVPSPVIEGYACTYDVVEGIMDGTTEYTVIYYRNTYSLTIHYVYANGEPAAEDYYSDIYYGDSYNVTSPAIMGYTPNPETVEGVIGAEDIEVTVVYSVNTYQLIIHFVFEDGTEAAPDYVGSCEYGANYAVTVPAVLGYEPDVELVEGVMGAEDCEVTVVYHAVSALLLGDVDCNGVVNFTDISVLYSFLLGNGELTDQGMANADFNQDGIVSFTDVSNLYSFLLGM